MNGLKGGALAACIVLGLAGCKQSADREGAGGDAAPVAAPAAGGDQAAAAVESEASKYVTDRTLLFKFLTDGGYKTFPVHDERHASVGPHEDVVVYYNQVAADSLKAGKAENTPGTMIVKEQYKPGQKELYGWSVSIKTHAKGDAGKGWYWIEFLDKNDASKTFPANPGNGVPECAACHTLGADLVRSAFPSK